MEKKISLWYEPASWCRDLLSVAMQVLPGMAWDGLPVAAVAAGGGLTWAGTLQFFLYDRKFWEVLNAVCCSQSFGRTERRHCPGRYEVKYQCCTVLRQAFNFNFKSTDVRKQEKSVLRLILAVSWKLV